MNVYKKFESKFKKKIILFVLVIGIIALITKVSLSVFQYVNVGTTSTLVLGDIYMASKDKDLTLNELRPLDATEGKINGSKYKFSVEGYNTSNKDIYYGIYINYGNEVEEKTRFKDEDIMLYLTETKDGITRDVYGPGSLKDFNDTLIYASTIDGEIKKEEKIELDYELTVWLSEKVLISDTETNIAGRSIYTTSEYENSYASVAVKVYGDFTEKNITTPTETINGILKDSQTEYSLQEEYENIKWIDEDVLITIQTTKEANKVVITNLTDNKKEEGVFSEENGNYVYHQEVNKTGKYSYYIEYADGTISQIYYYTIKIDRQSPSYIMESGEVINSSSIENGIIENEIT